VNLNTISNACEYVCNEIVSVAGIHQVLKDTSAWQNIYDCG